jgi:hypothetical protein
MDQDALYEGLDPPSQNVSAQFFDNGQLDLSIGAEYAERAKRTADIITSMIEESAIKGRSDHG